MINKKIMSMLMFFTIFLGACDSSSNSSSYSCSYNNSNTDTSSTTNESVYSIYLEYVKNNGTLSYEEWLEMIKDGGNIKSNDGNALYRLNDTTNEIEVSYDNGLTWKVIGYLTNETDEQDELKRYKYYPLPDGTLAISVGENKYFEKLTIPQMYHGKKVTTISESGFLGCTSLKDIVIPSSITTIGDRAFEKCKMLTSIAIPSSVVTMGEYVFNDCSSLKIICCEAKNNQEGWNLNWNKYIVSGYDRLDQYFDFNVVYEYAGEYGTYNDFNYAICISNGSKYATIIGYNGVDKKIELPDSINGINVTTIGESAFQNDSLTNVKIPNSVTIIKKYAFKGCSLLTSIVLSNSLITIEEHAFALCYSLAYIDFPSSVTTIDEEVFRGCSSLTSVIIPNSITTIGKYAFENYDSSLENVYCEVESKPEGWDSDWLLSSNTNVVWGYTEKHGTYNNFNYATFKNNENKYIEIRGYNGFDNEINIPSSINNIDVTTIGKRAFCNYSFLTNVKISNSVTTIGKYSFSNCSSLISIEIPNSVTTIGDYAFLDCESLTIYCEIDSEPSGWMSKWNILKYRTIVEINVIWQYAGEHGIYNDFKYVVCSSNGNLYAIILGYTGINTKIEIPESIKGVAVTTIYQSAFFNCSSLESIEIPDSVTTIGEDAFKNCSSLESIEIPDSVTTIGKYSFSNCSSLISIVIPNNVTTIGNYAFLNCESLTIYCEIDSKPSGWSTTWKDYYTKVYFNDEWHYDENGNPLANN